MNLVYDCKPRVPDVVYISRPVDEREQNRIQSYPLLNMWPSNELQQIYYRTKRILALRFPDKKDCYRSTVQCTAEANTDRYEASRGPSVIAELLVACSPTLLISLRLCVVLFCHVALMKLTKKTLSTVRCMLFYPPTVTISERVRFLGAKHMWVCPTVCGSVPKMSNLYLMMRQTHIKHKTVKEKLHICIQYRNKLFA